MMQWLGENLKAIGALLGSLFLFLFVKKGPTVATPPDPALPPVTPPVDPGGQDKKNDDQKKAEDQHTQDVTNIVQQQQDQEQDIVNDPNVENDFIKRVGEDVRKP